MSTLLHFRPRARRQHYAPPSLLRVRAYGLPRPGARCDAAPAPAAPAASRFAARPAAAASRGGMLPAPAPRFVMRRYTAQDLDTLLLQPAQAHLQAQLGARGYAQTLEACEAYTFAVAQGEETKILACVGVAHLAPHRALAWALVAGDCGPWFTAIHRRVRAWLAACPYTRVEAQVDARFAAGRRWLSLLGFKCETPRGMRGFCADGRAAHLYAYLKQ